VPILSDWAQAKRRAR